MRFMNNAFNIKGALLLAAASAFTMPAAAASVSNLDEVSHVVVFEETLGSKVERVVDSGETVHYAATSGHVYLRSKPQQRIAIDQLDRLAIWPKAELQIQMRRKNQRGD